MPKHKFTDEQKEELKKVTAQVDKHNADTEQAQRYGRMLGGALINRFPDLHDKPEDKERCVFNTLLVAPSLAEIIAKTVHRGWDSGEYLGVEWALEYFWGLEVKRSIPKLIEIYKILKDRKHTQKTPFVYNDMDYSIFYIRHKTKNIMVFDQQGYTQLVIHEKDFFREVINAVKIWPRTTKRYGFLYRPSLNYYRKKKWKLKYGDCRDKGYILAYSEMFSRVKVDHAYNYFSSISNWIWFIDVTLDNLKNPEEGQYE